MIWSLFLQFFSLILAYESILIFVFFSPKTSINLVTDLKANLTGTINLEEQLFYIIFNDIWQESDFGEIFGDNQDFLVVDATFDLYLSRIIQEYTENHQIVTLNLNSDGDVKGQWQFSPHNSLTQHLEAAESYIDYLGWEKLALISSKSSKSIKLASEYEKRQMLKVFARVSVSETMIESTLENLVGKIIKAQGVQMFLLLGEGKFYDNLLYWLRLKKVYKQGAGVLIGSRGIYGTPENGLIYYVEKGLEYASSESEYEMMAIKQFTDLIYSHAKILTQFHYNSVIDSASIRSLFEINTYQHSKHAVFSIVNIDNSQRVVKGEIDHNEIILNPNSSMIYPGETLVQPRQSRAEIRVSIAGGSTEPNGLPGNPYNSNNFLGSLYAQWYTNNGTAGLLENFSMNQYVTDCGSWIYNFTYYYNCMNPQKKELGLAFLSPSFEDSAIGYISVFRAMNLTIPHCGAWPGTDLLTNKTSFPEYVRVTTTSAYSAVTIARSLSYLGWNNVAVIYADSSSFISYYNTFIPESSRLGIKIINDEKHRIIANGYKRENFMQYKEVFQSVYDSKARIVIVFMSNPNTWHAAEGFYDVGFRKGDVVLVFYSKTGGAQAVTGDEESYLTKRRELMIGSLSASSEEYTGNYGEKIKSEIAAAFPTQDPSYKGFSFDAFMLAANGLDFSLNNGDDIEDPWVLNKNIRQQRFTGCTGFISIDSKSNNRNSIPINIFNFYYNSTSNTYIEKSVILYDPVSTIPFQVIQKPIFPGPSYIIPSDMRTKDYNCPFDQDLVRESKAGIGVLFGICFSISFIAGAICFFIWKRWKQIDYPKLEKVKKLKFADILVYLIAIIEWFQYIYIGPSPKSINPAVAYLSEAMTIDIDSLISFKGEIFWITTYVTLATVGFSLFLNIITVTRFRSFYSNIRICVQLESFSVLLMPLIGNVFFLPIVSFLLNIFSCTNGISDSVVDSYLDKDCYQFCWKDKHLYVALLSITAVFIYLPLTIYCRPIYQEMQESLHIKTSPRYLVIKSIFQVFFVVLKKSLGIFQPEIHGFVFFGIFCSFTYVINLNKPYNYEKFSFWLIISHAWIAWSVLFTALGNILETSFIPWLVCQIFGWAIILAYGLLKNKKFPTMIKTEKGIKISLLFRFMFGHDISVDDITKKQLNYAKKERYQLPDNSALAESIDLNNLKVIIESYNQNDVVNKHKEDIEEPSNDPISPEDFIINIGQGEGFEEDSIFMMQSNRKFLDD